jgi:hypothetical protein
MSYIDLATTRHLLHAISFTHSVSSVLCLKVNVYHDEGSKILAATVPFISFIPAFLMSSKLNLDFNFSPFGGVGFLQNNSIIHSTVIDQLYTVRSISFRNEFFK